jgi:hypothetical protein
MLPGDDEVIETETEEEIRITDEIVSHPTRDDWHEQRERGQTYESVLVAHATRATIVTIEVRRASR